MCTKALIIPQMKMKMMVEISSKKWFIMMTNLPDTLHTHHEYEGQFSL